MRASADLIATLAHTASPALAQGHHQWWRAWRDRLQRLPAQLRVPATAERALADPIGVTHVIDSLHGVRIGARLIEPAATAECGVVVLHGYGAGEPLSGRAPRLPKRAAVLRLRVRGFPGSTFDTGDLRSAPGGWIAQGLDDPDQSVLTGAVADVAIALAALKAHIGGGPIGLRGDSLGGGLAVIAAAVAREDGPVDRLALALPSLGDWGPRLRDAAARGASAEAAAALRDADPARAAAMRRTLILADAVHHAPRVVCPALCLLAAEDPVVPPRSAAAVFNALGSDPGLKARRLVERGHAELGRDDLRRCARFENLAGDFLDPRRDPAETLRQSPEPAF